MLGGVQGTWDISTNKTGTRQKVPVLNKLFCKKGKQTINKVGNKLDILSLTCDTLKWKCRKGS